jgi:hypothetical protein
MYRARRSSVWAGVSGLIVLAAQHQEQLGRLLKVSVAYSATERKNARKQFR